MVINDYFITEQDVSESGEKLELFDFDKYIKQQDLKEVKNSNLLSLNDKGFDPEGLWSETIFGRIGSKERKTRFGYVKLNNVMIRPVVYRLMKTYSDDIRKILTKTNKYRLGPKGELIEDEENGQTGLLFILNNYKKIDFEKCAKKEKTAVGKYINDNKDLIFINNYWIIPPGGIRDMSLARNVKLQKAEINEIYEKIIELNDQLNLYSFDDDMKSIIIQELFNCLLQAHVWNQDKMTGKTGLLRGTMLKKSMDYTARVIATPDPKIPFGSIGVPWHDLLVLYEPFIFHYVLKVKPEIQNLIKEFLKIEHEHPINTEEFKKLINTIVVNPNNITDPLKSELITGLETMLKGKDLIIKRDPVVGRGNYFSAEPIVLPNGRGMAINPLHCPPMTLDFDGDCVAAFPVFYEESLKEAAKLNPKKSKMIWLNMQKSGEQNFNLQLDCISTIYAATRD